jgi:hypothetical protein
MQTLSSQALARQIAAPPTPGVLARIIGEYTEMPGLSLTAPQAARLWQLDEQTCRSILAILVDRGFLTLTPRGVYVRRG